MPLAIRRRGGRKIVVMPEGEVATGAAPARDRIDPTLVKALARIAIEKLTPNAMWVSVTSRAGDSAALLRTIGTHSMVAGAPPDRRRQRRWQPKCPKSEHRATKPWIGTERRWPRIRSLYRNGLSDPIELSPPDIFWQSANYDFLGIASR